MITVELTQHTLTLIADEETRQDLAEKEGYWEKLDIISEALHEKWEFMEPEEIGALTEAPIIAACGEMSRDDHGTLIAIGTVAWFPDYMVRDWQAELEQGRTVFIVAD